MMIKRIRHASVVFMALVILLLHTPPAYAYYEGNSGTRWIPISQIEAWAWVRVSGSTSGRAYARVGNSISDTGWFSGGTQDASAIGMLGSSPVQHDYYVKG